MLNPDFARSPTSAKLPVKTFRLSRIKADAGDKATDWKECANMASVRTCVGDAKNYYDTDSYGRNDLPFVARLADRAHMFIFDPSRN